MSFYYGSLILSNCLLILSFVLGLSRWATLKRDKRHFFVAYLGFVLTIEVINEILIMLFYVQDISFIYPFYISGEFFLLMCLFLSIQKMSGSWYYVAAAVALLFFAEAAWLRSEGADVSAGYGKVISHLSIVCFSGYILIRAIRESGRIDYFLNIYSCLLLYYAISVFLFLILDQLTALTPRNAAVIWGMNNILSSVLYGVSWYTFLQLKK
ncbi:hypothetical protein [Sinomicrobium oceani]|uniref:hypothetical protein n=1 Tax=Sinomicrobium oceani TaxID=1150368 RepID=UPI00227C8D7F|nr:hypothetical protein [Sinomicrobium oceani]